MQLLCFSVGPEDYAIESRQVIEVLPLVAARPIPRMPAFFRGVFTYRGQIVPLVDLGRRLADRPLEERLSTRVILVEFSPPWGLPTQPAVRLGVAAENVGSLCSSDAAEASLPTMHPPGAAYLGRLLRIGGRTIQMIAVEHLLPPEIMAGLEVQLPACPPLPGVS
jgi:chemotaxis-related protein WspB